jgi:transposase-like protein
VKLGGPGSEVEVDETYIGGKARNMHRSKRERLSRDGGMQGGHGKAVVMGILERGGQVRARVIPNRKLQHVTPTVREFVDPGTILMTDEFDVYNRVGSDYVHKVVNHLEKYVDGTVHTNGIENFWALLKRGLGGTYVSVEPFHLFRYVDEQAFRFNTRKDENGVKISDGARFANAMSRVGGHRLTYSQLTGKDESPRHETTGAGETEIPFLSLSAVLFLRGAVSFLPFFLAFPIAVLGTLKSAIMPRSKFSRAFGPSIYSGSFIIGV